MGKIIVIEGTDCSGKETQSKLLYKKLEELGKKVKVFSFPMYETPTGKIVGESYLGRSGSSVFEEGAINVNPHIASLYYAADRKYNLEKINKYLDDDYIVILDRYISSNQAHQGSKIIDKDERFNMYQWIDKLEYWLLELPKPDITFFLYMPVDKIVELSKNREVLDEHEQDKEYLKRSSDAYKELSELYNWTTIECTKNNELRTIDEIHASILEKVLEHEKN